MMRAVVACVDRRGRRWRDEVVALRGGTVRVAAGAASDGLPRLNGVVAGAFTDAHAHLQLVDAAALADAPLGMVVDLGGEPRAVREIASRLPLTVAYAGAFLTPPGGYPSDRAWAPHGSVREIADADAAASAVAEMAAAGATCIKVASNSTAGPVFSDDLFSAIVAAARSHGLPVIAHAEGPGEAVRAARLGARILAHAPFTERLADDVLRRMRDQDVAWVSTLGIHEGDALAIATDNVRRFHALGGDVRYGTDMGNGDTPAGLNPREITGLRVAGIDGDDLLRALAPIDPRETRARLLLFPGATPSTVDPLDARLLTPADLDL